MKLFSRMALAVPALAAAIGGGLLVQHSTARAASGCGQNTQCVIAFGDARISDRIAKLNELLTDISNNKFLTSDQKSALSGDVNTNITAMQTLKTKLDAETTVDAARADVKSIYTQYRIYAVVLPRDTRTIVIDHLTDIQTKFASKESEINQLIQNAASQGKDVTQETQQYNDLVAKVSDSATQNTNAQSLLSSLTPQNFPGTKQTLEQIRADNKASRDDLVDARNDLYHILVELNLNPSTIQATATP